GIINCNGNEVLLGASALVSPAIGRSNSFIDGKVLKTISSTNQSFTFPVGDAGRWRPASINNVSTGGLTWEVEFKAASGLSDPVVDNYDFTNPAEIATILKSEHWVISDGNLGTTGVTATVGLSWGTESDVSPVMAEREQTEVMIWNDALSSWDNLGGQNFSSGHNQSEGRFVASNSNTFSEHIYTLGSSDPSNPLPVSLILFDAELAGEEVKLKWKTSSEVNNDYFEIEHSTDGASFKTIGYIKGSGTSSEVSSYELIHKSPEVGYNFYKLKQVDFDGKSTYEGDVVSVLIEKPGHQIFMVPFPNPTTADNINIKAEINEGLATIELYDAMGVNHLKKQITKSDLKSGIYKLKITSDLKPGIYIVKLTQYSQSLVKRIMIKEN
ncbi:T9SS type A sorting domain-containing protein, partial [Fulvivirga sp. RKSG066]|uniref:T9SS type A sorting domain-containing protein n=1 Tax=Fulvivirga aurantia TaxID=2529383 RepID=UPI0012BCED39